MWGGGYRGGGDPFSLEKCLGLLCRSVLLLLFACLFGFLVSKNYKISIPCFQEDLDPISKILRISLNGSSSFFGVRLFQKCQIMYFRSFESFEIYKINICKSISIVGAQGSTNPEIMEFGGLGLSHNKSEVLLGRNGAE